MRGLSLFPVPIPILLGEKHCTYSSIQNICNLSVSSCEIVTICLSRIMPNTKGYNIPVRKISSIQPDVPKIESNSTHTHIPFEIYLQLLSTNKEDNPFFEVLNKLLSSSSSREDESC